jgi:hypothetical protein
MTDLPRFLDGPKFVAWLESEGVTKTGLTESQYRRWFDWERGARADLYTASTDQLLTDNYLHNLIPDDVWARDQEPVSRGPKKQRQATSKPATT